MFKLKLTLTLLFASVLTLNAQNTEPKSTEPEEKADIPVYFRFGSDVVDTEYKSNHETMIEIGNLLTDHSIKIDSIQMVASASPEGSVPFNYNLAGRRASAMTKFIADRYPRVAKKVTTSIKLYSWADLAEAVKNDPNVPNRDEVIKTLDHYGEDQNVITALRHIKGNLNSFNYLEENYLSKMRSAANCLIYYVPQDKSRTVVVKWPVDVPDSAYHYVEREFKYPWIQFRSNLLVPLTNIGVEVPIGNRFSVAADWYTPWMFRKKDHKWAFQFQMANFEGYYWLGDKHLNISDNRQYRMTGHAVGVYLYGGKYDFEHNWNGHQGEFWSAGASYMYAIPAWKNRLRFEFSASFGYLYCQSYEYDVYNYGGKLYTRSSERAKRHLVLPTKAAVSIVYPLFKKYKKVVREAK